MFTLFVTFLLEQIFKLFVIKIPEQTSSEFITTEESLTLSEADTKEIMDEILYNEQICQIHVDEELNQKLIHLEREVIEIMSKSIEKKEAFDLLARYDETTHRVHEVEIEQWFKAGIRLGFMFHQIINQQTKQKQPFWLL